MCGADTFLARKPVDCHVMQLYHSARLFVRLPFFICLLTMIGLFCPKRPFAGVDLPPHGNIPLALLPRPITAIFLWPYSRSPPPWQYSFGLMAAPPHGDIFFGLVATPLTGISPPALRPRLLMAIFHLCLTAVIGFLFASWQ
jgi:hypothetical protein